MMIGDEYSLLAENFWGLDLGLDGDRLRTRILRYLIRRGRG